jgi:hypothetical protein
MGKKEKLLKWYDKLGLTIAIVFFLVAASAMQKEEKIPQVECLNIK